MASAKRFDTDRPVEQHVVLGMALRLLSALGCGEPQPSASPRELTLPAPREGVAIVAAAARTLQEAGIDVSDLGLRRPTLDDVFMTLTGEHVAEPDAPERGEEAAA